MLKKKYLQSFLSNYKDERSKVQFLNIFQSLIFKGGAIFSNFLLVPLTINYLTIETYGLWIAISSMIAWVSFLDGGLGNGLKNKLSESIALNNMDLAKIYVSTAYFGIVAISLILIILFSVFHYFVDWNKILSLKSTSVENLDLIIYILFVLFCIKFIFELINSILAAIQKVGYSNLINFITNIIILFCVYILTLNVSKNKLLILSIIVSIIPIFVLLLFSIYFFNFNSLLKKIKPNYFYFKLKEFKEIYELGIKFFIIQMAVLIIFSTDNFIILKLYDGEQVAIYNIAFKYFSIITLGWSIIIAPYWTAFSEAYVKNDFIWLRKTMNFLFKLWTFSLLLVIILIIFSKLLFKIWLGQKYEVSFILICLMALYVSLLTFTQIFSNFINSTGKIKLQTYGSIIIAILNIPCSIFFSYTLNLGLYGIIIGTILSMLPGTILGYIQYNKIINNKQSNIWNL